MHNEISYLIININNKKCLENLINNFYPLIKKYSYKLNYDGAETDLVIKFIETVKNLSNIPNILDNEKALISYINKSIINYYIYLSKKNSNISKYESLEKEEVNYDNFIFKFMENGFKKIELEEALNTLNLREEYIIKNILNGYSVSEIASNLNITRQAVNKIKINTFTKLKNYYCKS